MRAVCSSDLAVTLIFISLPFSERPLVLCSVNESSLSYRHSMSDQPLPDAHEASAEAKNADNDAVVIAQDNEGEPDVAEKVPFPQVLTLCQFTLLHFAPLPCAVIHFVNVYLRSFGFVWLISPVPGNTLPRASAFFTPQITRGQFLVVDLF